MKYQKNPLDTGHADDDLELLLKEVTRVIQEIETMLADTEGAEE